MNSKCNGLLLSIYLLMFCIISCLVLCLQHKSSDKFADNSDNQHFQPFLNALSLQISPETHSDEHQMSVSATHSRQTGARSSLKAAFPSISPNRVQNPNKLPLYRGKRLNESVSSFESNAQELKLSLKYFSSLNRFNANMKHRARQYIIDTFRNFGLNVTKQHFRDPYVENDGINIIGIRKGSVRREFEQNKTKFRSPVNDRILIIGAHYDTVKNTSGLNDNGSGIGVMLEMVRLLENCQLEYSILFVAFDLEELGAIGSKYFVHEYLIPNELDNTIYRSQFKGAIIMDTLLNFNSQPGTQDIPNDIHMNVPEFSDAIKSSNYSGDFLAMFARTSIDQPISRLIEEKWRNHDIKQSQQTRDETNWRQFKLKPVPIRTISKSKVASYEDLQRHVNMLRSDHLHFWYHNHSSYADSLSAVLLTDTGPFRGYMRYCYHKMCDDSRFLSENNVNFVRKTVDVLMQVVLTIVEGKCSIERGGIQGNIRGAH